MNTGTPDHNQNVPNMPINNSRYISSLPTDDDDDTDQNIYQFSSRYSSLDTEPEQKEEKELVKPFTINVA